MRLISHTSLVTTERHHREIHYAPNFEAVNGLVLFLLDDCCGGDATACAGLNLSHLSAPKC